MLTFVFNIFAFMLMLCWECHASEARQKEKDGREGGKTKT
jgi:hypothetical protein